MLKSSACAKSPTFSRQRRATSAWLTERFFKLREFYLETCFGVFVARIRENILNNRIAGLFHEFISQFIQSALNVYDSIRH